MNEITETVTPDIAHIQEISVCTKQKLKLHTYTCIPVDGIGSLMVG